MVGIRSSCREITVGSLLYTPYDAVYVELARRRKLPLATLDAALVKAARAAKFPLITALSVFPDR
jgi:predicted nucleic acid-binding protein